MSTDNVKKMSEPEPKLIENSLKAASPVLIRILEVIIGALCICLIFVPYDNRLQTSIHKSGVVCIAFSLPVIINVIVLVSHFQRFPVPKIALYGFSFVTGVLLFAAGCILVSDWWTFMRSIQFYPPKMFLDLLLSSGIFSFLNSLFVFSDIYLTFKYY